MRFVLAALVACAAMATPVLAADVPQKSIEALYHDKAQLKGQQVRVHGKVVKASNGIMQRNFLHIQDGSGGQGTNDLTVTSTDTAEVGDEVVVTGTIVLDRDFGAGYVYPLLLEQATIGKAAK